MSDFVFSSDVSQGESLAPDLRRVYTPTDRPVKCFEGPWGTLAVFHDSICGCSVYEDSAIIVVLCGAPVVPADLHSHSPQPINHPDRAFAAWKAYLANELMNVRGPFCLLQIDKSVSRITVVTDHLSFIPVYVNSRAGRLVLSTHPDIAAHTAGHRGLLRLDPVAITDFIIHHHVVAPHTLFQDLFQLPPGTLTSWHMGKQISQTSYWRPLEVDQFRSIRDAGAAVREHFLDYIHKSCSGAPEIGVLLSGGEDSRLTLACLPDECAKHAFTITDTMNREARAARKVANAYGAKWHFQERDLDYYPKQFRAAIALVGFQNEANQVHALRFAQTAKLATFPIVAGGLYSDTFLKGYFVKRKDLRLGNFNLHSSALPEENVYKFDSSHYESIFRQEILSEVFRRRTAHLRLVQELRPLTAQEWSRLWPITHHRDVVGYQGNRRLFRTFEPFMDSALIKISAGTPQQWKLNRALFRAAFCESFSRSRFILHAGEGHFPAFGVGFNFLAVPAVQFSRAVKRRVLGLAEFAQGPWPRFDLVFKSAAMQTIVKEEEAKFDLIRSTLSDEVTTYEKFVDHPALSYSQRFLAVQMIELAGSSHHAGLSQ